MERTNSKKITFVIKKALSFLNILPFEQNKLPENEAEVVSFKKFRLIEEEASSPRLCVNRTCDKRFVTGSISFIYLDKINAACVAAPAHYRQKTKCRLRKFWRRGLVIAAAVLFAESQ